MYFSVVTRIVFIFLLLGLSQSYAEIKPKIVIDHKSHIVQSFDLVPPHSVILKIFSYQQTTKYTCGPAAIMVLLYYYGKLSAKDMNHKMELRIADQMGATERGSATSQIVSWLKNNGFKVEVGRRVSVELLKLNISRGIPTLVVFENHWTLATGYSVDGYGNDSIIFTDSYSKKRILSRGQIDSLWLKTLCFASHCSGSVGDYIIATPVKTGP